MNNHQISLEENFSSSKLILILSDYPRSSFTNINSRFSDHPPDRQQNNSRSENFAHLEEKNFSSSFNSNKKDWTFRNGRNGMIKSSYISEDDILFREHLEQMEKKQTFDFSNLKSVDLKVIYRGKDVLDTNEMKIFEDFPELDKMIAENLRRMKFSLMTPIQKAVMPYIIKGNDVMGCSHTGSGKTVAFLLPIITKMLKEGPPVDEHDDGIARPITLVLIPTRELADQIFKEARKLVHKTGITVVKIYGGVGQHGQIRELSYGCDILIATPGRLIDFIKSRRVSLNMTKYLIIDEADRLLDMGFEPQLNNIVFDYDLRSKDKRLNLMFSATLEDDVKTIARKFMNEYYFIHTNTEVKASQNVTQMLLYAKEEEKIIQLHHFLQKIKGSIINTKRGVENLSHFLEKSNYNVIAIHGDKKQFQRQDAIQKFTNGEVPILIATDVAARGLDFPKVSYVFNYDMPSNIDSYIHRIGRTGRCGDKGVAVSFINDNNKNIIKSLFNLMKSQNQEIPEWLERMYKNVGSLSLSSHNNNRNKSERDHNYLNKKRKEDFDLSKEPRQNPVVNTYSGWGKIPDLQPNDKLSRYNNDVPSQKSSYDYGKYLSMNFSNYLPVNNTSNTNPSSIPNTISNNNLPNTNVPSTSSASASNLNSFQQYYPTQTYNNYLPKFTYSNIGYYPNQNYNSISQNPQSQNVGTESNLKNIPYTPNFKVNQGDSHDHSRRSESSRNEINLNNNEWIDLKDYGDKNYSKDNNKRREKDRERERERDLDRDRDRDRDRNRDRERDREREKEYYRSSREYDHHRRSRQDDKYYK